MRKKDDLTSHQLNLTSLQKELWLSHLGLHEEHPGISCGGLFELDGIPDPEVLQQSLKILVQHFPLLSSTLQKTRDVFPVFETGVFPEPEFTCHDFRNEHNPEQRAQGALRNFIETPFTPIAGPLCRFILLNISDHRCMFANRFFHLAGDGIVCITHFNIMASIYNDLLAGHRVEGVVQDWQDDVDQDRKHLASTRVEKDKAYWREQLELLPREAIFSARPGRADRIETIARLEYDLPDEIRERLNRFSAANKAGINDILMALHLLVLSRLYDRDRLVVQVPFRYGEHRDQWAIHGHRVNVVPLWVEIGADTTFVSLLTDIKRRMLALLRRTRTPFQPAFRDAGELQDLTRIWDASFNFFGLATDGDLGGIQVQQVSPLTSRYDPVAFGVYVVQTTGDKHLHFSIDYSLNHFSQKDVQNYLARLEQLTGKIFDAPQTLLRKCDVLLPEEQALLRQWQAGQIVWFKKETIPALFASRAAEHGDRPAITADGETCSYRTVSLRSDRIAAWLLESGIDHGNVVAVLARRHAALPETILGILKIGAVYLPVDPDLPEERIRHMLTDSGAVKIIALETDDAGILADRFTAEMVPESSSDAGVSVFSDHEAAAYLIYTSGSTGTPKGVLVSHAAFANMIQAQISFFGIGPADHILQFASPSFDASLSEIFMALLAGACLYPVPRSLIDEPWSLRDFMAENRITVVTFPPSYLRIFNRESFPGLRILITAGEPPLPDDVRHYAAELEYINAYGPTEASVCATMTRLLPTSSGTTGLIGRPIANTSAYILDRAGYPVVPGIPGELCLAGAGLAIGYLNRSELTAQRFTPAVFNPELRLYRTGDRAGWNPDGSIILYGRLDDQVKIRGHRIELGEIRIALESLPEIAQAEVVAVAGSGRHLDLVAFLVADNSVELENTRLRERLSRQLPDYMIPVRFQWVETLPVGATGKVDRQKLLRLAQKKNFPQQSAIGKKSTRERAVLDIFEQVLGEPVSSTSADFFVLGGDSIRIVELGRRLSEHFKQTFSTRQLLTDSSVSGVMALLQQGTERKKSSEYRSGYLPLNQSQRQLWVLNRMHPDSAQYNMPLAVEIEADDLDFNMIARALRSAADRQPSCRVVVTGDIDRPLFRLCDTSQLSVEYHDLRTSNDPELAGRQLISRNIHRPFSLDSTPPVRALLLQLDQRHWYLLLVMHHIIGDGISLRILLKDMFASLTQTVTGGLSSELLVEFVHAEKRYLQSSEAEDDLAWWREKLTPAPARLDLVRSPRPENKSGNGDMVKITLPAGTAESLHELAAAAATTLLVCFLTNVLDFLVHKTGKTDVAVTVPVDLRDSPKLYEVIGYFVNTVILRAPEVAAAHLVERIGETGRRFAATVEHGRYPFSLLAGELGERRDPSRSPLVDILATVIDEARMLEGMELPENWHIRPVDVSLHAAKLDYSFILHARLSGALDIVLEYDTDVAARDEAEALLSDFTEFLQAAVQVEPAGAQKVNLARQNTPEKELAAVWQQILGVREVSAESNFFACGGDSIKAIQMVGQLRRRGINGIAPADLFSRPDFGRISALAAKGSRPQETSGTVHNLRPGDEVVLLPMQRRLLHNHPEHWQCFYMVLPLRLEDCIDDTRLMQAVRQLPARHEALRLSFSPEGRATLREKQPPAVAEEWISTAISGVNSVVREGANLVFERLDPTAGQVFGAILIRYQDQRFLVLGGHHLVLDAVSLDILRRELAWFCRYGDWPDQQEQCGPGAWALQLAGQQQEEQWLRERQQWLDICAFETTPLPGYRIGGRDRAAERLTKTLQVVLQHPLTSRPQLDLLSALSLALYLQGTREPVLLNMEGHGREAVFPGLDIGQSVGWFTSTYPLLLTPAEQIDQVRAQLSDWFEDLQAGGLGYAILSRDDPEALKYTPQISFNYLGQLTGNHDQDGLVPLPEVATPAALPGLLHPDFCSDAPLDIILYSSGGAELVVTAWFSPYCLEQQWVFDLLTTFEQVLCSEETWSLPWQEMAAACQCQPGEIASVFELTTPQESMLYQQQLEGAASLTYTQQINFRLQGALDEARFVQAWHFVVDRHPGLRSLFPVSSTGDFKWLILTKGRVLVEQIDLSHLPAAMQEHLLKEKQEHRRSQPFALDRGPLLFMQLFRLVGDTFEMSWCFHHILMDGWCIGILLRELFAAYVALGHDSLPEGPPAPALEKYLQWLRRYDEKAALSYWQEYLAGLGQVTPLVPPGASNQDSSCSMQEQQVELDEQTTEKLLGLAGRANVSLSILVQAAWGLLLSTEQATGARDVLFGLVTSGRPAEVEGIEEMVGLFIRTVPVRIRCTGTEALGTLLDRIQEEALARAPFEFLSLADIQKCASLETALFDHILVFENYPLDGIEQEGAPAITAVSGFEQHPYALAVSIIPGRKLLFRFTYNLVQCKESFLLRLLKRWQNLLKQLSEAREPVCADFLSEVLPEQVATTVADTLNATARPYPGNSSIPELFREVAAGQPEFVAVIGPENAVWDYGQLDRLSDAVAAGLDKLTAGEPVAVAMQRGPEAIAVFLGILKAGGCYLPVDAKNPQKRVAGMLQVAGCRRIIHDREALSIIPESGVLRLSAEELLAGSPEQVSPVDIKAEHPAYVMFTSGSTGEPKGVLVPHRAVLRLACNNGFLELSSAERMLQAAPPGFDASTLEIWGTLLAGAALCCISDEALLSPGKLKERIFADNITVMWLTAGLCNLLVEEDVSLFASLRVLLTGGESLSVPHMAKLMAACPELTVINGYGPTENTTFTTTHCILPVDLQGEAIPIGRPVGNTRVYIVRDDGSLAEPGEWGELCAAGDGLALGYIGAEELTRASFVHLDSPVSERVYRTGDCARWRSDGVLEFRGRMDNQVKIRGYRIEPAEIEAVLLRISGVMQAAVVAPGRGEDRRLVAFVRLRERTTDCSAEPIMTALADRLPSYMIPERIEWLDEFPLTVNGKLDRKALAEMLDSSGPERSVPQPGSDEIETGLMALYAEILQQPIASPEADFFQLGGQSLKAMRLLARLNSRFCVELSLRDVLAYTTVAALAGRVRTKRLQENGDVQPITSVGELGDYPLSGSQERLWFLQRLQPLSSVYTLPFAVRLQGNIDTVCLQQALYRLEQHHDALRLRVPRAMGDHDLRQQLAAPGELRLAVHDYSQSSDPTGRITRRLAVEISRPFSFGYDQPLVRALLLKKDESEAVLLILCHHLISDGLSAELLVRDLKTAYECALAGRTPSWSDFPVRYVDYAAWQQAMITGPVGERLRERWLERLLPLAEPLELPLDRPRPSVRSFAGAVHRFRIDRETSQGLVDFARSAATTLFSALAALVNVFLYRHTGQTEISIGVPVAGRQHPELEQLAGCFVNTLPLHLHLDPESGFAALLHSLTQEWQACLADQLYPFEALVDALDLPREASRNPLFDVLVALEEKSWTAAGKMGDLRLSPYPLKHEFSKVDISFYFREVDGQLEIDIEYCTDLFELQTIERMGKRFVTLARAVLENPEKAIGTLEVMPEDEQWLVLNDFNDTAQSWNLEQTIDDLFREQASQSGAAAAIRAADGTTLSFNVFDRQVQELAHGLARHVQAGELVGVCCRRSPELLQIIFAVLRIGAVYVPFVPGLPRDRVAAMLEDSGTTLIVSEPESVAALRHHPCTVLTPDEVRSRGDGTGCSGADPDAAAYVLFTSGSTGRPKGVVIEQRSVVNRIFWMQSCFPLDGTDVILQKTPVSFDVSIWELFWWSWTGATLAQLPVDGEKDPAVIVQMIAECRATVIHFVPSMLQVFLHHLETNHKSVEMIASLRYVFASGEALTPDLVERFNRLIYQVNGTELHNLYGPTEATVDVTWQPCSPAPGEFSVPIGRPIANTAIYILDSLGNPCPPGVAGELCISGVQVARGYINRPELTKQCFQPDPFVPGRRMYRTGDLACRRSDGSIEYLGRRDNQVKIRGFRIELGEIEIALEKIKDVAQAVVRVTEFGGMPALEAFLLARTGGELTRSFLRRELENFLPEYMIPSLFYQVEHIPLNISGKADRKALSGRLLTGSAAKASAGQSEPARDDSLSRAEEIISGFWHRVLPENVQFGRHENFFDVGGNSLLLIRLHELLEKKWPTAFSLPDLFVKVTVAQQADRFGQPDAEAFRGQENRRSGAADAEAVAVIGMALRLADFDEPVAFWADLLAGVDRTGPMSEVRQQETCAMLAAIGVQASAAKLREAAYLADISGFDCGRFGLAPMDVTLMDPEQRLFLETVFRSLEDGGYGGSALANTRVGVFVGASPSQTFKEAVSRSFQDRAEQIYVLNVPSNMAARPGYMMNWNGPAELVDTACSSTLKAVLDGCTALRQGSCDLVIAGGARVLLTPLRSGRAFTIESGTGRTRTFDAAADGVGAGEGAVVFLLKPLSRARADGDAIRAVIRGGAVNQDGRSASIAAPNPAAQAEVIRAAADAAGVALSSLDFFEAHGTGTALGDPVEIDGLRRAFAAEKVHPQKAAISSVKGNYGHLDAAAGGLGMAKAILALQYGVVPRQPHYHSPNPRINFQSAPVFVVEENYFLDAQEQPWRCGVSAFGLSGINVHLILEQAPFRKLPAEDDGWYMVPISASSAEGLRDAVELLLEHVAGHPNWPLSAVAATLISGRDHLPWRLAIIAGNVQEFLEKLLNWRLSTEPDTLSSITDSGRLVPAGRCLEEQETEAIQKAFADGDTPVWPDDAPIVRLHLPPVPLERKRLWPQFKTPDVSRGKGLLTTALDTPEGRQFTVPVTTDSFWPITEHRLAGRPALVGMAIVSMLAEAMAREASSVLPLCITGLTWLRPLLQDEVKSACLRLSPAEEGFHCRLSGRGHDDIWYDYAEAVVSRHEYPPDSGEVMDIASLQQSMSMLTLPGPEEGSSAVQVSERWNCRRQVWCSADKIRILARLQLQDEYWADLEEIPWHPALLDVAASLALDRSGLVPSGCREIRLFHPLAPQLYSFVSRVEGTTGETNVLTVNCLLLDDTGKVLVEIRGLSFLAPVRPQARLYPLEWRPRPLLQLPERPAESLFLVGAGERTTRLAVKLKEQGCGVSVEAIPGTAARAEKLAAKVLETGCNRLCWILPESEPVWQPLFALFKRLLNYGLRQSLQVLLVGRGALALDGLSGGDSLAPPDNALAMGLLSSVIQEEPLLSGHYLECAEDVAVECVADELLGMDFRETEPIVLDRQGNRFGREPGVPLAEPETFNVSENSVVVFSGGLGAMALTLAETVGSRFNARIALLHRGEFPAAEQWQELLEESNDSRLSWRIKQLQRLQAAGIDFHLYSCDICQADALQQTLAELRAELGPVQGVIHTAGLAGAGFLMHKQRDAFEEVLAPKVSGTRNLHDLTLDDELRFFVLAASRTGLLGAPGQSDYTAANAYLDAFAWWRQQQGLPALSIDWNSWADIGMAAWSESGVSSQAEDVAMTLSPEQAGPLLLQALSSSSGQLLVAMSGEIFSGQQQDAPDTDLQSLSEELPSLSEKVERIWARELGYETRLAGDADFYALGGDSITGLKIVQRINRELGQSLNLADLFSRSILDDFTARLEENGKPGEAPRQPPAAPDRPDYPVSREQLAVIQAVVAAGAPHTAYNLPQFMRLPRAIDHHRLEEAFRQLIVRHEILRTRFCGIDTPWPTMEIVPEVSFSLNSRSVQDFSQQSCQEFIQPFDLETGPLFRALVLKNPGGERVLFFDIHHAIADARTIDILLAELMSLYQSRELPLPGPQQKDAAWLQGQQGVAEDEARAYWLSRFGGELPLLDLPADRLRPPRHTNRGAALTFAVPPDQLTRLRELARAQSTTPYTIVLSLWHILLARYTRKDELVLAVAVDNRDQQEFSRTTGMFVSLLPLLLSYAGEEHFSALLQRNHAWHADAMRYKFFGLHQLLSELQAPVMPERTPLAEVTFSYMNFSSEVSPDSDIQLERLEVINPSAKADLAIFASDTPEQLSFALEYYSDLFTPERIRRMGDHFLTLLREVLSKGAELPVREYSMLPSGAVIGHAAHGGAGRPFQAQDLLAAGHKFAQTHAGQTATVSEHLSLTWQELMAGARRVAAGLRKIGVQPGDSVGLAVTQDARFPALMLGVLCNGAICSLNHFEPDIMETPHFFIAGEGAKQRGQSAVVCCLEDLWNEPESLPVGQEYPAKDSNIAFSCRERDGKWAKLRHELLLFFALQLREALADSEQRIVSAIPPDTVLGLQLLWSVLLSGREFYLGPAPDQEKSLIDFILKSKAGTCIAGDGLVRQLTAWKPAALRPLQQIISLGDTPATGGQDRGFRSCCPGISVVSGLLIPAARLVMAWYCETEAVSSPYYRAGKPADSVIVSIVDKDGNPVPAGIWGGLVVQGPAAEILDRFLADNAEKPAFRIGRWSFEAELELGGTGCEQSDDALQLYLALLHLPRVREAAVWRNENGKWQAVVAADGDFSAGRVRSVLRRRLPVRLSGIEVGTCRRLPLTPEGSVDFAALGKMRTAIKTGPEVPPGRRAEAEAMIVNMFREVLQQQTIGRDDSFFELGGHSLLALQIINRLAGLSARKITIRDLFEYPTPAELAGRLVESEADPEAVIPRLMPTADSRFPLSHAQQRLYVQHQMEGGAVAYNMPFAFSVSTDFNLDIFRKALHSLCTRHEILRTSFLEEDGQLWQVVHDVCAPVIAVDRLHANQRQKALAAFQHEITLPFDLGSMPLFRWHVCFLGEDEVILLLVMHHIIGDGWSIQLMFSELMALYNMHVGIIGDELPELPVQYKDYAVWQQNHDWQEAAAYWRKTLAGAPARIELPLDSPLPDHHHAVLGVCTRRLDDTVLAGLRELAVKNGVSLATLLLTLFAALLYHLTRQEDMVIGMGVAGREREELEGIIGFFVNILPVRIRMNAETDVNELLRSVNTSVLESLERQDYPFDLLVREIAPVRRANRDVLVNVMFEYQRFSDLSRIHRKPDDRSPVYTPLDLDALVEEDSSADRRIARYDLTLFVQDEPEGCRLRAEFDGEIVHAATITNWLKYYEDFMVMTLNDE